jgi:hypothetical protein
MLEPKHMSWARAVTAAAARLPTRRCSPPYFSLFLQRFSILLVFNMSFFASAGRGQAVLKVFFAAGFGRPRARQRL